MCWKDLSASHRSAAVVRVSVVMDHFVCLGALNSMRGERVAQVGVDVKNERARKCGVHPEC